MWDRAGTEAIGEATADEPIRIDTRE